MKLSVRLTLSMTFLVTLTSSVVGYLVYREFSANVLPLAVDRLKVHSAELARALDLHVGVVRQDVRALGGAVENVEFAKTVGEAGQESDAARRRLEEWFASELKAKPAYIQIRLVSAPGGIELVRVDRSGAKGTVRVVPQNELQPKAHRGYVKATLTLSRGEVISSAIDLNREHGSIEKPHVPVLRVSTPVFAGARMFGMIVINVDMRSAFDSLRPASHKTRIYVVNRDGYYLTHPDPSKTFAFEYGRKARFQSEFPESAWSILQEKAATVREIESENSESVVVASAPAQPGGDQTVFVVEAAPLSVILGRAEKVRRASVGAGFAALCVGVLLALFVARSLSRPVTALTKLVESFRRGERVEQSVHAAGEIGRLSRAFDDMAQEVSAKTSALEREVADRRAAEESLARTNKRLQSYTVELKRSNAELEHYARVASHDLREPLRMVVTSMTLLEQNYKDHLDARAKKFIGYAVDGARRMSQLVTDLLDYSRLDTEETPPVAVDANRALASALTLIQSAISESKARIVTESLPMVLVREPQLVQVFQNLVSNAVKFRSEEAPVINISAKQERDECVFSVSDNGIGISVSDPESIFDVFMRVHTRGKFEGNGIGLAIVKKVVEQHGGKVWFESREGDGTVFHFTLPAAEAQRAAL